MEDLYIIKVISKKNVREYSFIIVDKKRLTDSLAKYKDSKKVSIELVGALCLK